MNDDKIGCLELIALIVAIAIVFALAWMVANSDLPEWMKYFLLK